LFVTLSEENILRMTEKEVLSRIFGPKMEKVVKSGGFVWGM